MEELKSLPDLGALQKSHPGLRAVLFDMDGTLLRTEELHADVLRAMAVAWGLRPPFPPAETEERLKGLSDGQVYSQAQSWPGFPAGLTLEQFVADKNRRLVELIPRLPLEGWTEPRLAEFLARARSEGLLLGLVTSSERVVTEALLARAGLAQAFELILTFQDVRHAKPHPEPYLKAMLSLGVGPRETLVFEDSVPGMASARAAGTRVVRANWW